MRSLRALTDIANSFFVFESHIGVTASGGAVPSWTDQSNSVLTAANVTPAKQPAYTASNASFNGYPTVDWPFARLADQIYLETGALPTPVAAKPMTFIAVYQCTDFAASRILFSNRFPTTTSQASLLVVGSTGAVRITGKVPPLFDSAANTVVANQVMVSVCVVNSLATHYKNRNVVGQGACGGFLMDGIRLGNTGFDSVGSIPFSGSIAVLAGWSRELGAGEIAGALDILLPRYGIASLAARTVLPAPGAVGGRTWLV